jgi:hypothetical protein
MSAADLLELLEGQRGNGGIGDDRMASGTVDSSRVGGRERQSGGNQGEWRSETLTTPDEIQSLVLLRVRPRHSSLPPFHFFPFFHFSEEHTIIGLVAAIS